jgi:hypothetical protein
LGNPREKNEMGGACGTYWGTAKMHTGLWLGKPEGKRQLGRPKCKWGGNIQMDVQEIGWRVVDWTDLA